MPMTTTQAKAYIEVIAIVLEAIKDAGPQGVPSGHMYAMLMGHMSLETYERIISILVQSGRVRLSGHVLYVVER